MKDEDLGALLKLKFIKKEMPRTMKTLELLPLVDLHVGDSNTDIKLFYKFRDYILAKPNRFITLQGDLMNNAVKSSVSNVYNESINPQEQKKFLLRELKPIKDRILAIIPGNHEHRTSKDSDVSLMEDLAIMLGLEDLYSDNGLFIKISLGERVNKQRQISYNIFLTHGSGGGGKVGGTINRLEDYAYAIEGLDLMISGHVHKKFATCPSKLVIDSRNMCIRNKPFVVCSASAWQNYGGYALRMMLRPSSKGKTPIILGGTEKYITAEISTKY